MFFRFILLSFSGVSESIKARMEGGKRDEYDTSQHTWYASLNLIRLHKQRKWKTTEWNKNARKNRNCRFMMCLSGCSQKKKSENDCHELHTFSDDERQTHFFSVLLFTCQVSELKFRIFFNFEFYVLRSTKIRNSNFFVHNQQISCIFKGRWTFNSGKLKNSDKIQIKNLLKTFLRFKQMSLNFNLCKSC